MSHDPHVSCPIFTSIKTSLALSAAFILWMYFCFSLSAEVNELWKDRPIVGAMLVFSVYVYLWCIGQLVEHARLPLAWQILRIFLAIFAMALAKDEMVKFATDGAPAITWPMQNEWSAQFIAIVIIVLCAIEVIPRALTWVNNKIGDYS